MMSHPSEQDSIPHNFQRNHSFGYDTFPEKPRELTISSSSDGGIKAEHSSFPVPMFDQTCPEMMYIPAEVDFGNPNVFKDRGVICLRGPPVSGMGVGYGPGLPYAIPPSSLPPQDGILGPYPGAFIPPPPHVHSHMPQMGPPPLDNPNGELAYDSMAQRSMQSATEMMYGAGLPPPGIPQPQQQPQQFPGQRLPVIRSTLPQSMSVENKLNMQSAHISASSSVGAEGSPKARVSPTPSGYSEGAPCPASFHYVTFASHPHNYPPQLHPQECTPQLHLNKSVSEGNFLSKTVFTGASAGPLQQPLSASGPYSLQQHSHRHDPEPPLRHILPPSKGSVVDAHTHQEYSRPSSATEKGPASNPNNTLELTRRSSSVSPHHDHNNAHHHQQQQQHLQAQSVSEQNHVTHLHYHSRAHPTSVPHSQTSKDAAPCHAKKQVSLGNSAPPPTAAAASFAPKSKQKDNQSVVKMSYKDKLLANTPGSKDCSHVENRVKMSAKDPEEAKAKTEPSSFRDETQRSSSSGTSRPRQSSSGTHSPSLPHTTDAVDDETSIPCAQMCQALKSMQQQLGQNIPLKLLRKYYSAANGNTQKALASFQNSVWFKKYAQARGSRSAGDGAVRGQNSLSDGEDQKENTDRSRANPPAAYHTAPTVPLPGAIAAWLTSEGGADDSLAYPPTLPHASSYTGSGRMRTLSGSSNSSRESSCVAVHFSSQQEPTGNQEHSLQPNGLSSYDTPGTYALNLRSLPTQSPAKGKEDKTKDGSYAQYLKEMMQLTERVGQDLQHTHNHRDRPCQGSVLEHSAPKRATEDVGLFAFSGVGEEPWKVSETPKFEYDAAASTAAETGEGDFFRTERAGAWPNHAWHEFSQRDDTSSFDLRHQSHSDSLDSKTRFPDRLSPSKVEQEHGFLSRSTKSKVSPWGHVKPARTQPQAIPRHEPRALLEGEPGSAGSASSSYSSDVDWDSAGTGLSNSFSYGLPALYSSPQGSPCRNSLATTDRTGSLTDTATNSAASDAVVLPQNRGGEDCIPSPSASLPLSPEQKTIQSPRKQNNLHINVSAPSRTAPPTNRQSKESSRAHRPTPVNTLAPASPSAVSMAQIWSKQQLASPGSPSPSPHTQHKLTNYVDFAHYKGLFKRSQLATSPGILIPNSEAHQLLGDSLIAMI